MPTPSIGRIVHYQSHGTPGGEYLPESRAAIVTEVKGCDPALKREGCPHASLAVLTPTGMHFAQEVPFAEQPTPGHWNWPPRVDQG
ncbi:hypothetical protein NDR87_26370 [Nocardia sp. CDC159]|uniref:Uncharacterized protein n=1 Tax=Nocardia pulmonis TaxID=2951408 RepID=A0A9X2EBA3_9NOCA|nr:MULTISPECIES: hypothetical protein [Nocardia]MCM6774973.1 hypothetical protein [Nocardia pulmonis]MCM6789904.1 hypothetical protein [Nocardia sp. CDC159]